MGLGKAGAYQVPVWAVWASFRFSLVPFPVALFPPVSLSFFSFFFLSKKIPIMETGSYVCSKSRVCLFFFSFFPSAFIAPFSFFLIFNSCIYPCLLLFDLSGVLKKRLCLLISHFLSYSLSFPYSFYSYKNSSDHYISPTTNFLCHPLLFFLFLFLSLTTHFYDD